MLEIERKFLIKDLVQIRPFLVNGLSLMQGYLFDEQDKSLRVRIASNKATITMKFGVNALVREEFEYEIPMEDAESLWRLCSKKLSKTRYRLMHAGNLWEIDVFHEKNEGLVLAEIELSAPNQAFEPPFWLGEEVTDDARYLNVNLAQ